MSQLKNSLISRRRLLENTGVGLGLATGFISPLLLSACSEAPPPDSAALPDNLQQFMGVSQALTGKQQLNPVIGERLLALLDAQPGFIAGLAELAPLPKGDPDSWLATQQKTAQDIMSAWYLGKVGEGFDAQVVSYEKALMFDAVAGVLVIRSYCSGKPGYWAEKPAAAA